MAKTQKFTSPKGELSWVQITGKGKRNYNDDGDIYCATLTLTRDTARPLIDELLTYWKDNKPSDVDKPKSLGLYAMQKDEDGDDKMKSLSLKALIDDSWKGDTINLLVSTNVVMPDGKKTKIQVYNAKGNKIELGDILIGNGSIGCISGAYGLYIAKKTAGVTIYLNAIQLIELIEYEGGAGFSEQEGSFNNIEQNETGFKTEEESSTEAKPKL